MKGNYRTLRKQFIIGVLSVLFITAIISGAVQLYFMNDQIETQTNHQAETLAENVLRGINQTDLATENIEHQIDLKLVSHAKHIADLLDRKKAEDITQKELTEIRDKLNLSGITIFKEKNNDVTGVVGTDKNEIGFSFKEFGYYEVAKTLLSGKEPKLPITTYSDAQTIILPISQSASNSEKPTFYKYAYYVAAGTDYMINPYIEANEVYEYTETAGTAATLAKLVKENDILDEIAILNPEVYKNPSLAEKLYPPLKKIEAGKFNYISEKDKKLLTGEKVEKSTYVEKVKGKKVYKMFFPIDESKAIYIALDYDKMSGPLYRHSIILIISGLASLVVLFLLTARFFNRIYENLQKIKLQITSLEEGDLTVKSEIRDGSELEVLSQSTNRMMDQLNTLITDTQEQAIKAQRLSVILESEASDSVEKMYTLSTEATIKSREQLNEITSFLDEISDVMKMNSHQETDDVLAKVNTLKQIAKDRTAATTDTTITLSDLVQSLHEQARELSDISRTLLAYIGKFKL
ncbi:methyl-accepting chemotaxis protein [Rossellomorea oryzaecorticis]|uniref:Methyl-accepting chemotaxis protein n=1 Tax=Rossellomorea oryzaecorticis TaxID=1396505 RepID=A0ABW8VS48_9BACI